MKKLVPSIIVITLLGIHVVSRTSNHENWEKTIVKTDALRLPSPSALSVASLNFRTFAADLAWVLSLVSRGDDVREKRASGYYLENGAALVAVDPLFRKAYDLFPAIFLQSDPNVSHQDLLDISHFYELGFDHFPEDPLLRFDAGLIFIGYSQDREKDVRLKELRTALRHMRAASIHPQAPPQTTGLVAYFSQRIRTLSDDEGEVWEPSDKELLTSLLLNSSDPNFQKYLRLQLMELGVDTDELLAAENNRNEKLVMNQIQNQKSYLPIALFWLVEK